MNLRKIPQNKINEIVAFTDLSADKVELIPALKTPEGLIEFMIMNNSSAVLNSLNNAGYVIENTTDEGLEDFIYNQFFVQDNKADIINVLKSVPYLNNMVGVTGGWKTFFKIVTNYKPTTQITSAMSTLETDDGSGEDGGSGSGGTWNWGRIMNGVGGLIGGFFGIGGGGGTLSPEEKAALMEQRRLAAEAEAKKRRNIMLIGGGVLLVIIIAIFALKK